MSVQPSFVGLVCFKYIYIHETKQKPIRRESQCTDGVLRCRIGMQTAERQTRLLSREMTGIAGVRTKEMINTVSTPAVCARDDN